MEAVDAVAHTPTIRALIITGKGEQAFVSGGDLKELNQDVRQETGKRLNAIMSAALVQLAQLPIPVIAAVNGDAFGGGCEIVTACDLRLASETARFSFAQVRVGLVSGWGGTARLINLIGQSRAMEILLTARIFDAAEAQRLGLIHRVFARRAARVACCPNLGGGADPTASSCAGGNEIACLCKFGTNN